MNMILISKDGLIVDRLPFPAQCAAWIVLIAALLGVGWWVGRAVVEAVVL